MPRKSPAKEPPAQQLPSASAFQVTMTDLDRKLDPIHERLIEIREAVVESRTESKKDHEQLSATVQRIEADLKEQSKAHDALGERVHDLEQGVKFGKWLVRSAWAVVVTSAGGLVAAAGFLLSNWDKITAFLHGKPPE